MIRKTDDPKKLMVSIPVRRLDGFGANPEIQREEVIMEVTFDDRGYARTRFVETRQHSRDTAGVPWRTDRYTFDLPTGLNAWVHTRLWEQLAGLILVMEGDEPTKSDLTDDDRRALLQFLLAAAIGRMRKVRIGLTIPEAAIQLRTKLKFGRKEMAQSLGVSVPMVYAVETGNRRYSLTMLMKLANLSWMAHEWHLAEFFEAESKHAYQKESLTVVEEQLS